MWLCYLCGESARVSEPRWLAGCMGFVWVHADSLKLHCVASPFHSFVATCGSSSLAFSPVASVASVQLISTTSTHPGARYMCVSSHCCWHRWVAARMHVAARMVVG